MKKLTILGALIAAAAALTVVASSYGGNSAPTKASTLPSSACGPVFYKGSGRPQYLIASDLPLQGAGRAQPISINKAIQYVLEREYKFKAGKYTIGFQACDDATAQTGGWDSAKCSSNGRAYAAERTLRALIGTFNSGCAKLILPLVNRAPGGPIAMLSPANTAVGLTHVKAPISEPGEPQKYYPTGVRNYVRVATSDDFQGPAGAVLLKQLKKTSVYILHDNQTFGKGVAQAFQVKARQLGITVRGFEAWDAKAASYSATGERIKGTNATAVYLGGIVCNNGAKLIKDLRAAVGNNVTFVGPDGFTPFSATAQAGSAAEGMYISVAGLPIEKLGPTGRKFLAAFRKYQKKAQIDPYAVYGAQLAQIALRAIATSDGSRASVIKQVFKTNLTDGIMGKVRFDKNGDIVAKAISFYQMKGGNGVYKAVIAGKI
jgi:branched-chain amino acid transport system substrate-binding protein